MTTPIHRKNSGGSRNRHPHGGAVMKKVLVSTRDNLLLRSMFEVFRIFCRETNLHGMKHIFGAKSDYNRWHKRFAVRISRCLWFLSCVAGIFCAIVMMRLVLIRFQNSPTITTIDTTNHPIWEVPFPSVTVCNLNKVYAPHSKNVTSQLMDRGVSAERIYKFYGLLPNLMNPEVVNEDFLNISILLRDIGYTTETLMLELVQPCENLLKVCFWKGNEYPCNKLFKMSRSTEGICCSFNYKAIKSSLEMDTDFNYTVQNIFYVSGAGRTMGLNVLMDPETTQSLALAKSAYGIEVLIHDAEEFPQASVSSAIGQPGTEVIMSIVPSVISSKPAIRSVPVQERQCYFADEQTLRAARKYSLNSCLAECRVDYIVAKCDCVPFFYPDLPAIQDKYRQCGLNDVACLRTYRTFLSSLQPPNGTVGFNTSKEIGMDCTCLPSCSETTYGLNTIDVRRTPGLEYSLFPDINTSNMTTLLVYFRDLNVIRYRRDLYMTWDGLFASIGGIFGLCLGGSVLSLVEMGYFFTIRLALTIYRKLIGKAKEREIQKKQRKSRKALANSRRIYTLTPILNSHFWGHAEKKAVKSVW